MGVDLYSFERDMFGLFELLTGDGVGAITRENVHITVSDEFLRRVGGRLLVDFTN